MREERTGKGDVGLENVLSESTGGECCDLDLAIISTSGNHVLVEGVEVKVHNLGLVDIENRAIEGKTACLLQAVDQERATAAAGANAEPLGVGLDVVALSGNGRPHVIVAELLLSWLAMDMAILGLTNKPDDKTQVEMIEYASVH